MVFSVRSVCSVFTVVSLVAKLILLLIPPEAYTIWTHFWQGQIVNYVELTILQGRLFPRVELTMRKYRFLSECCSMSLRPIPVRYDDVPRSR